MPPSVLWEALEYRVIEVSIRCGWFGAYKKCTNRQDEESATKLYYVDEFYFRGLPACTHPSLALLRWR